jgi:valyl-tRNA synthetase
VGHCYRCRSVIEPYLSEQWFVKMKPLAEPALESVMTEEIKFYPDRWVKVYQNWMDNIRDWCISRQLWWGHRIPVWYCDGCGKETVAREAPRSCPACGKEQLRQDENVLDTWFSSWLWPFSTLGWPSDTDDLNYFYPTTSLVTGPDIIFFWVARMIMAGIEFMGGVPFKDVFFTGIIRDQQGRKMSKSLGNSPDPLDVIDRYGADALRFTIARLSPVGQDVYYSNDSCELGRNFANKIWNATRFALISMDGVDIPADDSGLSYSTDDRYILSRLHTTIEGVTQSLETYKFNEAAQALYDFFWNHFCDRYIEAVKPLLKDKNGDAGKRSCFVLNYCLDLFLKLLCPFMPFIAEELWQMLPEKPAGYAESITTTSWPTPDSSLIDQEIMRQAEIKFEIIRLARKLRKENGVPDNREVSVVFKPASPQEEKLISENREVCRRLMKASKIAVDANAGPSPTMVAAPTSLGSIVYVELCDSLAVEKKLELLQKEIEQIDSAIKRIERELSNQDFIKKAPKEVVEQRRKRRKELSEKRSNIQKDLELLSR